MIEVLKALVKVILVIVGLVVVGIASFFTWLSYTSPVNEAGREFKKSVSAYRNEKIENMDDVYERLEVLDSHFNSPTFNKVHGGEKREVTLSNIQTLFGEPDQTIEEVDMDFIYTVYKYNYDNLTLNIHQGSSTIDEFVLEDFTNTLYTSEELDQIFMNTIMNHQTSFTNTEEELVPITEEMLAELTLGQIPTRIVQLSGWHSLTYNRQHYFDDGRGEYAPTEYVLMLFKEEENIKITDYMERRYNEIYTQKHTPAEVEQKQAALDHFTEIIEANESADGSHSFYVEDFVNEFGNISRMFYDFQNGLLNISWLINGQYLEEITVRVQITNDNEMSTIKDLMKLEIISFDSRRVYNYDLSLNTNNFIGSK